PNKKGAIIDRGVAEKSGVGLGDEVEIFGEDFKVVGLSEGTASLFNSVAFIARDDFTDMRNSADIVSFLLVKVKEGYSPESVATQIESLVNDVTAQPRIEFAEQERKVIKDMSTDVIAMMNLIAFFIGLGALT
ncbi:MAG: ABC transporter permease, partial [Chloroflexi bacterium]|nr:ABC transporter permease [Chloroflexota bacterium]